MKLDLSKFKKIDCDDNCTTLLHPSGHEFKIAHKGLSPEVMENLEAIPMHLAKGGFAKYAQKYDPGMKPKASKPSKSTNTMPGSPTEAKDAFTEPQDQGPDVVIAALNKQAPPFGPLGEPKFHTPPCINPSCKSYGKPHPNCRCYGGKMGMSGGYAKGGKVDNYCSANRAHEEGCQYFAYKGLVEGDTESSPVPTETPPPQDQTSQGYGPEALPPGSPLPELKSTPNAAQELNDGTGLSQQAPQDIVIPETNEQELEAEINKAEAESKKVMDQQPQEPQEQPKTPIQSFEEHKNNAAQELFPEAQAFQADLDNGHIQPKTYHDLFAEKSTLGKIGTLFGLLLGGAGAGMAGQPNALLEMMNKEIDRDLDAQQKSVGNKQNYLTINQHNLMNKAEVGALDVENKTKAYALAKAQMNYAALHKLVSDTQKLPPGPQKDQAMQTLAMMNQTVQNENFNILDRAATATALGKTIFGGQGGANTGIMKSGLMGPEAKEMGADIEEKTIPGIPGRASKPIPQQKRDQLQAMQVLDAKIADTLSFAKAHKGTLSPNQRKIGEQKAHELMNFYNSSIDNGVLTQGRMAWLDKQVGKNPTSIFQDLLGNNAQLEEIQKSNNTRKNLMLKGLGFNVSNGASQSAPQEQIKTVNGVKYKRGPHGEAIKVE